MAGGSDQTPVPPNPFSSLGGGQAAAGTPSGQTDQGDILSKMQEMMGGMLGGMETRLNKASNDLRTSVTGQIGQVPCPYLNWVTEWLRMRERLRALRDWLREK